MNKRVILGFAALVLATAIAPAFHRPAVAATYQATMKACDSENKKKAGSCQKKEDEIGVLHGCAGTVCFACPTDGRRKCFPEAGGPGGVIQANMPVRVGPSGTNVEAVVKACDYVAEHGGKCNYTTDKLHVVEGTSGGRGFQCIAKRECHPR